MTSARAGAVVPQGPPVQSGGTLDDEFDVVVLGAGAGGMTAALAAALAGKRTLVVERSGQVGGTTAYSSGTVWIPDNADMREAGTSDDRTRATAYLDALVGERADRALRQAFLSAGPEMLAALAERAGIRFRAYPEAPDYRQDLPGAALGGRPMEPEPFDGRELGTAFDRVRWPIPELMLFGGMMVTRSEAARLVRFYRSPDAIRLGGRLVARYLRDRLRHPRGTRLVLGNALSARLFRALLDRGVDVWFDAKTVRLVRDADRVTGLVVERDGSRRSVRVADGVVLAGGGFPASADLRQRYLPEPVPVHSPAYEGCTGETLGLAQAVGATLGPIGEDNALWFPSSIARRRDGTTAVYPHIVLDRGKPGIVAVNAAGLRFVNEASSYHEFSRAMYRSHRQVPSIPAWLVCDRRFVRRYGLGIIRPLTPSLRGYVARGYLHSADTVEGLAAQIGVDAAGLVATVREHNAAAASGVDRIFGKGADAFDRASGDPSHGPNPCLGPIERGPFLAVAVWPTPLGTSLGLLTDSHARVLDAEGRPIPGLYACGNDMHSPFGGEYPGGGAELGLALTFGWLAGMHAAGRRPAVNAPSD